MTWGGGVLYSYNSYPIHSLSLSLSLIHTHTHARSLARAHTHTQTITHTHTHTYCLGLCPCLSFDSERVYMCLFLILFVLLFFFYFCWWTSHVNVGRAFSFRVLVLFQKAKEPNNKNKFHHKQLLFIALSNTSFVFSAGSYLCIPSLLQSLMHHIHTSCFLALGSIGHISIPMIIHHHLCLSTSTYAFDILSFN